MEMKAGFAPGCCAAAARRRRSGGGAVAATSDVSPTGFVVTLRHEVKATPHRVWEALGEIDKWWNGSHSWSGQAANLSLATQAGGCFCERWGANSVMHARVIHAAEDRMLRLEGSLGPLQALATTSILTFALAPKDGGTTPDRHLPGRRQRGRGAAAARRAGGRRDRRAGAAPGRLRRDRQARSGQALRARQYSTRRRFWPPRRKPFGSPTIQRASSSRRWLPTSNAGNCTVTVSKPSRLTTWNWIQAAVVVGDHADDAVEVGLELVALLEKAAVLRVAEDLAGNCDAALGEPRLELLDLGREILGDRHPGAGPQVEAEDDVVEHLGVAVLALPRIAAEVAHLQVAEGVLRVEAVRRLRHRLQHVELLRQAGEVAEGGLAGAVGDAANCAPAPPGRPGCGPAPRRPGVSVRRDIPRVPSFAPARITQPVPARRRDGDPA